MSLAEAVAVEFHEFVHSEIARTSDGALQIALTLAQFHLGPGETRILSTVNRILMCRGIRTQEFAATYAYFYMLAQEGLYPNPERVDKLAPYYRRCFREAEGFLQPYILPPRAAYFFLEAIAIWSYRTGLIYDIVVGRIENLDGLVQALEDGRYWPDQRLDQILHHLAQPRIIAALNESFLAVWPELAEYGCLDWVTPVDELADREFNSNFNRIVSEHLPPSFFRQDDESTEGNNGLRAPDKVDFVVDFFATDVLSRFFGARLARVMAKVGDTLRDYYTEGGTGFRFRWNPCVVVPHPGRHRQVETAEFLGYLKLAQLDEEGRVSSSLFAVPNVVRHYEDPRKGSYSIEDVDLYLSECNGDLAVVVRRVPFAEFVAILISRYHVFYMFHVEMLELTTFRFLTLDIEKLPFDPLVVVAPATNAQLVVGVVQAILAKYGRAEYTYVSPEVAARLWSRMSEMKTHLLVLQAGEEKRWTVCLPMSEAILRILSREGLFGKMTAIEEPSERLFRTAVVVYQQLCFRGL